MASRRTWWILGTAVASLFLCLALTTAGVLLIIPYWNGSGPSAGSVSATASSAPTESRPTETDFPTTTAPAVIPPDIRAQMEAIEEQVVSLRGLNPEGPVQRALLTPEQLRQHLLQDLQLQYSQEEAEQDVRLFVLLGLLEPGFDLWNLYLELYSEQVVGFYDDELGQMFVVTGTAFGAADRLTYAHEYVHALQDQNYDLDQGLDLNDEACAVDSDRCAAVLALVEGDAMLLQKQWLRTFATPEDLEELLAFADTTQSPIFNAAPGFLQQDFLFPYLHGLDFVTQLYIEGNWIAVDTAYGDPPVSTEQILHPERYPDDRPTRIVLADDLAAALGGAWEVLDQGILGEWTTRLMLAAHLESQQAVEATTGWGGDYYRTFHNRQTGQDALVLVTDWDGFAEAHEFYLASQTYGDSRFGPGQLDTYLSMWVSTEGYAILERSDEQTLWILAPETSAAEALHHALVFPAPTQ